MGAALPTRQLYGFARSLSDSSLVESILIFERTLSRTLRPHKTSVDCVISQRVPHFQYFTSNRKAL